MRPSRLAAVALAVGASVAVGSCSQGQACARSAGASKGPTPRSPAASSPKPAPAPPVTKAVSPPPTPKAGGYGAPPVSPLKAGESPRPDGPTRYGTPPKVVPAPPGVPRPAEPQTAARVKPAPDVPYVAPPEPGRDLGDPYDRRNPYNRYNPRSPSYRYFWGDDEDDDEERRVWEERQSRGC